VGSQCSPSGASTVFTAPEQPASQDIGLRQALATVYEAASAASAESACYQWQQAQGRRVRSSLARPKRHPAETVGAACHAFDQDPRPDTATYTGVQDASSPHIIHKSACCSSQVVGFAIINTTSCCVAGCKGYGGQAPRCAAVAEGGATTQPRFATRAGGMAAP
jgi:hypothetical protein